MDLVAVLDKQQVKSHAVVLYCCQLMLNDNCSPVNFEKN